MEVLRDHAQNNVIPLLIGPPAGGPITSFVYHVSERTPPSPFPVTGNRHGGVTEPKGDHFSGRILAMIPNLLLFTNVVT